MLWLPKWCSAAGYRGGRRWDHAETRCLPHPPDPAAFSRAQASTLTTSHRALGGVMAAVLHREAACIGSYACIRLWLSNSSSDFGQHPTRSDESPRAPRVFTCEHQTKGCLASMPLKPLGDKEVKAGDLRKAAGALGGAKGRISLHNSFPHFKGRLRSQGLLLLKLLSAVSVQRRRDQSWLLQLPGDISKCSSERR